MVIKINGRNLKISIGIVFSIGIVLSFRDGFLASLNASNKSSPYDVNCEDFFNKLYQNSPDWELNTQLTEEYTPDNVEISQYIRKFNIYNHCFIGKKPYSALDIESRVFPWLSFQYPIFQNMDGQVYNLPHSINVKSIAQVSSDLRYNGVDVGIYKHDPRKDLSSFWTEYNKYSQGRGIILTMSDDHLDMAIRLISNLRLLGTKLPLQIIHHGEINEKTASALINASQCDDIPYVQKFFDELEMQKSENLDKTMPKLNIQFVNTKSAIKTHKLFDKYYRKFLAALFNTFEEFIMIDVDAVLFTKPETFFETSQYIDTQTLFFKDRNLYNPRPSYFRQLFDSSKPGDFENTNFGVPLLPFDIQQEEYLKYDQVDNMESGVVVMDKLKHFSGLLMTAFLSMRKPIADLNYGDKELWWLGQLLAGNSRFSFNEHWAANTGPLSKGRSGLKSKEVCSTHPSHISSDTDKLMWINTGAFHCRDFNPSEFQNDFSIMSSRYPDEIQSIDDLRQYYKAPVTFEYIMIPPPNNLLLNQADQPAGEPLLGFLVSPCCNGYMWCGYDQIGNGDTADKRGQLIKVPELDRLFYDYIAHSYTLPVLL